MGRWLDDGGWRLISSLQGFEVKTLLGYRTIISEWNAWKRRHFIPRSQKLKQMLPSSPKRRGDRNSWVPLCPQWTSPGLMGDVSLLRKKRIPSSWYRSLDYLCAWRIGHTWKIGLGNPLIWLRSSNVQSRVGWLGVAPWLGWDIQKSSAVLLSPSLPCYVWRRIWKNMAITCLPFPSWHCIVNWPMLSKAPWRKPSPAPPNYDYFAWPGNVACVRPLDNYGRRWLRNWMIFLKPSTPSKRPVNLGSAQYSWGNGGESLTTVWRCWDRLDPFERWGCLLFYCLFLASQLIIIYPLSQANSGRNASKRIIKADCVCVPTPFDTRYTVEFLGNTGE